MRSKASCQLPRGRWFESFTGRAKVKLMFRLGCVASYEYPHSHLVAKITTKSKDERILIHLILSNTSNEDAS